MSQENKNSGQKQKKKMEKKIDLKEMAFLDHLEELRWRILKCLGAIMVGFIIAMFFSGKLLNILTRPNDILNKPAELIFLKPTGMLMVRMEIAFVAGLIGTSWFIFIQFWKFVAPGLLSKEKKYFLPSLLLTALWFLLGICFSYFIIIPQVLPFLYQMGTESIRATINITEYISFTLRLILVAGLIFELPTLSFFLSRLGLISPAFLRKYRRYSIVLVFIVSAIITPPDPASQILMALPLLLLYEISIGFSKFGYSRKQASDEVWEKKYGSEKKEK